MEVSPRYRDFVDIGRPRWALVPPFGVEGTLTEALGGELDGPAPIAIVEAVHRCQQSRRARIGDSEQIPLPRPFPHPLLQKHAALRIDTPRLIHGLHHPAGEAGDAARLIAWRRQSGLTGKSGRANACP